MKCILWLASGIAAMEISSKIGKRLKAHLVGGNTRTDRQLCLIKNPLTHPPDTFVWIQVVLCAILRDTDMNQTVRKGSPGTGEVTCFKYASSTLEASMFGSYCLKIAMICLDTSE
jgi:hypothetical protein